MKNALFQTNERFITFYYGHSPIAFIFGYPLQFQPGLQMSSKIKNKQTNKQTDKQTDKQTNRQTNTQ